MLEIGIKERIEDDLQEAVVNIVQNGLIITESEKSYYLKSGSPSSTYLCEANSLKELALAEVIGVARVASVGKDYILTEYINSSYPSGDFFTLLGSQLAQLHHQQAPDYGFYEDNFIGATPQLNRATDEESKDWPTFFFNKRLLYQYRLAEKNNYITETLRKGMLFLEKNIKSIIGESIEKPTLLHGDLWAGNFICSDKNKPYLIDPAVYYGHREADLAMTKVFGGFSPEFYRSYQREFPLSIGWEHREPLYKLYHILNHLNLFGRGYLKEAEQLMSYYMG